MRTMLARLAVLLFLAPGLLLFTVAGVDAQDKWSFVLTPQVWFENIRNNGFAASNNAGGGLCTIGGFQCFLGMPSDSLSNTGAEPTSTFFPQWGAQFAAQYGRWTFGVAGQYVSFETSNTFSFTDKKLPVLVFAPGLPVVQAAVSSQFIGTTAYTEIINTDRVDVDLTATYFFPDVIKDIMDVTTGLGFKWIRASGHRSISDNNSPFTVGAPVNYILHRNGCQGSLQTAVLQSSTCLQNRASFLDQFYGATIPTTLNFHLTRDGNWLLPLTMTPFLGTEGRSDDVTGWQTSFAYGGTFDVGVRYVFENGVAAYAGWRGQAIHGNNLFFAQGPLVNLSVRFGGK